MRILLTTPLLGGFSTKEPMPPLGITYIAGTLEQNGYTVRILDNYLKKTNASEFVKIVKEFMPSIIGITCNVENRFDAFKLSNIIKETSKEIIVILGGPFPSVCHKEIIEDIMSVDVAVKGEGEYTLLDIVKCVEQGNQFDDIEGITYRTKDGIKINKSRTYIKNLDELHFPAFHLLKIYEYPDYMRKYRDGFLGKTNKNAVYTASLIFGRGCPFNCSFCSSKELWQRSYRMLSPENAIRQIEYFINLGVNAFAFFDDHLLLNKKWFSEFTKQIRKKELKFIFKCLARADSIDKEIVGELKDIGCKTITIGIESGSPDVLTLMKKSSNVARTENAVKLLRENGILDTGGCILNIPGETFENILESLRFFKGLGDKYRRHFSLPVNVIIYPGTDLERIAIKNGHITNFRWTKHYYEKRNLLVNSSPYTPLYENVPVEKLVEYVIRAALKIKFYSFLTSIVLCQIVWGSVESKFVGRHYKRNFYISKLLQIFLEAPTKDKIIYLISFLSMLFLKLKSNFNRIIQIYIKLLIKKFREEH